MGRLVSDRERELQRKLIPLNILVCILALVAAITLFITPLVKVDVGKVLGSESVIEFADEMIDKAIGDNVEDAGEGVQIDYKPVVQMIVRQVFGSAEGSIAITGTSTLKALTSDGENRAQVVMDDLLLGENALAAKLIDSVVDGVANLFDTDEGKAIVEETVVTTFATAFINEAKQDITDEDLNNALTEENVKSLVNVIGGLGDETKVVDGKVDKVTDEFIVKLEEMVGGDFEIDADARESINDEVQRIYDETKAELKAGEKVTTEAIICVTLSKNIDLSEINLKDMIGNLLGENNGESGDASWDAAEGETDSGETTPPAENKIVTNYNDLLVEVGFTEEDKEELKAEMHEKLETKLDELIKENNIDEYLQYYGYATAVFAVFMLPWVILFLFSFFHILAKNKRFTMWYVKLFGWIPALFWLVFTVAKNETIFNKITELMGMGEEETALVKGLLSGIGSLTWITGLCYILLWLVSIFWAFPIKHKIRKERKEAR